MTPETILSLAGQFGAMGLLIGYLMWRDVRRDALDRERIVADKALATSLALLEAAIKGMR